MGGIDMVPSGQINETEVEPTDTLKRLRELEISRRLTPEELVLKGRCIQLAAESDFTLADAEAAFNEALEQASDYVPALLELGWFYHAVQDQSARALTFFEKAYKLSVGSLKESIKGQLEARADIDPELNEEAYKVEAADLTNRLLFP